MLTFLKDLATMIMRWPSPSSARLWFCATELLLYFGGLIRVYSIVLSCLLPLCGWVHQGEGRGLPDWLWQLLITPLVGSKEICRKCEFVSQQMRVEGAANSGSTGTIKDLTKRSDEDTQAFGKLFLHWVNGSFDAVFCPVLTGQQTGQGYGTTQVKLPRNCPTVRTPFFSLVSLWWWWNSVWVPTHESEWFHLELSIGQTIMAIFTIIICVPMALFISLHLFSCWL